MLERAHPLTRERGARVDRRTIVLLIDSIPDEEILEHEDPDDANGDGVSGIASRVHVSDAREVGRFGWMAEVPRLSDFVCRALGGELGLTAPDQGRGFGLARDPDSVPDPETSQQALDDLGFYVATLAAPPRAETGDAAAVRRGETLFGRIGCAACHVPVLQGSLGPVALYSDLLLHEIRASKQEGGVVIERGCGPASPIADASRTLPVRPPFARGFRTAPLWGVGRTAPYLHDGRAKTLADAVLAHEVEADSARERYAALREEERQSLLAFLESP